MTDFDKPVPYNPLDEDSNRRAMDRARQSFLQAIVDGLETRQYSWELIGDPNKDRIHLISCKDEDAAKEFASRGLADGVSIGALISSRVMTLEDYDE